MTDTAYTVSHNPAQHRFEVAVEGQFAIAEYTMPSPSVMRLTHTVVPKALEGRGIAGALARFAMAHARSKLRRSRCEASHATAGSSWSGRSSCRCATPPRPRASSRCKPNSRNNAAGPSSCALRRCRRNEPGDGVVGPGAR